MPAPEVRSSDLAGDDLLWRHLKSVPAFRALLRAVEARYYRHLDIPEPILDLGCGDGHFAQMVFDRPLTAGVDPWWGPLQKARRAGIYRLNVQALGHTLPFADETFASVISNSVLEHIPEVQPVLDDAARVLRPGGKLVITMPSHLFTEYLGGAALLRPLGLSHAYRRFFNRISRHAHTDPPEIWARRLAQAGFSVERWQYYFSREALHALEMGHVQGLPSALLHGLTGHWILAPWRDNLRFTERWLRPYYEETPPDTGAYLMMIARKTGHAVPITNGFEVRLPAPRPLPIHEPDAPDHSQPDEVVPQSPDAEPPEDETVFTFRASDSTESAAEPAPTAALGNRGPLAILLLLAGLLAASTGQSILSQRLPSPWSGLTWYALAFAAFAAGALLLRRHTEDWRTTIGFTRRLLLYPLAYALALMAQEQSGASVFGGSPLLAIVLWLAGIAVAYLALATKPPWSRTEAGSVSEASLREPHSTIIERRLPLTIPLFAAVLFLLALLPRLFLLTSHPFILNGIEASLGLDALAVLDGQIRNPFATAWLTNPTLPLFPAAVPLALFGRGVLGVRLLSALVGALTVPILFLFARRLWNVWFALAASLFLAGYHLHVHYSRLGMTNVWDPLLALLIFGAIAIAAVESSRRNWLLAGLATGFGAYFYTASHLLPFLLIAFAFYLVLIRRDFVRQNWPHLLAAAAMGLVVALPQIVYYMAHPGIFMERANALGILQNDWLLQQVSAGNAVGAVLADQLRRALLAFNGSLDTSTSYNPGIALLAFWPSIFFVLGVGVAFWQVRRIRDALLLIWLAVTLLFGGALLVDVPGSHRLLIAAPAVALLTTTGLFWLVRQAFSAASLLSSASALQNLRAIPAYALVALLVVFLFVAGDLFFYFGEYRGSHRFGDRNSEVAHEMGLYLDSLEGEWQAYFHGPPAMYVTFPTILYLADAFRTGENLFDVPENGPAATDAAPQGNLVFIYLPERSDEVNQTAEQYPQGAFLTFDGNLSNPLFYAYEVRR